MKTPAQKDETFFYLSLILLFAVIVAAGWVFWKD
jgi:flagellar biogenesis protein FliO